MKRPSPELGRLSRLRLLGVAFLAGWVIMALEIAGARLLAPAFGYSIYQWGALIGVVMTGMAMGYELGGRVGDRPRSSVVLGVFLAITYQIPPLRISWLPWRLAPWRWLITAHVELWRNTPLLVQLFWVHFALPNLTGISTTVFVSGVIALSLQASAYLTEIARAGIDAVPKGQWEAANSLGLPGPTRWLTIILPQAMKIMIPPLANTAISFFKATTVLSLLAVGELMTISNTIANFTFKQIEVLTAVGVIFYVLGSVFSSATYKLENVLKRSER